MADYETPDTEEAPPQPTGAPSPALQEFAGVFTHPAAKEWASEVTTQLNDYFQRRQIVADNEAAGQHFVNDLDQFKGGLVSMVESDPQAVHTALAIVPPTMSAILASMPNAPENADAHHAALTEHMQSEIAVAAITSAAETHEGLARSLISNPRVQDALGEAAGPLSTYIDMQAAARARDEQAAAGQAEAARLELADQSGRNYLSALVDPNNGQPRSPPGWNQAVLADNRVPPQDKVALFNAHEQLGRNGDAQTDPLAVMDLIHKAARGEVSQQDLYPMIGSSLSMADAGYLAEQLKTATQNPRSAIRQIDQTIQAAARTIAPHGDVAETRALGRFVDWLLPQVRTGGDVDPRSPNTVFPEVNSEAHGIFWNSFRVNGDDLLGNRQPGMGPPGLEGTGDRPNLSDIFSKGGKTIPAMPRIPRAPEPKLEQRADATPPPKDYMSEYERNQERQNTPAPLPLPLGPEGKDYMTDYEKNQKGTG